MEEVYVSAQTEGCAQESSDAFILYDFHMEKHLTNLFKLCSVNMYGGRCVSGPCDLICKTRNEVLLQTKLATEIITGSTDCI